MASNYETLLDYMTRAGMNRVEADLAAKRCAGAMARRGYASGVAAGIVTGYFMGMNPLAVIPMSVTVASGAAVYTLLTAEACEDIRRAARFWMRQAF